MTRIDNTGYILMTDARVNPARPDKTQDTNPYYTPNSEQVLYVVSREGSKELKAFTSYGHITDWEVGAAAPVIADQSRRWLGYHTIVGIVDNNGVHRGEVPNRALRHGVFK